ncbi:MAG: hypothetical protein MAG795_00348 [Candidatus Woesearchaeota archaeon]|nr:hypothetical protein [Candidatus Woesearchaeota archaeon]
MKALFVCYDGYKTTNVRVRCYRFAKELQKHKIQAKVFSFKDDLDASYDGQQSYKVGFFERVSLLFRATKHLIKQDRKTTFYIQKAGFFAIAPLLVHFIKKNPIVLDYDDYEYELSIISRPLTKILAKRSIFCVGASRFLQNMLKKWSNKVYYVPTGVDLETFKPTNLEHEDKSDDSKVVFLWIGMIVDQEALQNVLFIVDSFDKIQNKNAVLHIVGGGDLMKKVENLIQKKSSPNIIFKGRLDPDEVPKYLETVDVGLFVLLKDSKYNKSKSPTKLFEYMAKQLAVICTDIGESGSIIAHNKNGLIIKTQQDFIKSCELLVDDKRLLNKLKKNSKKTVEKDYNLEEIGKKLAKIMKKEL